MGQKSPLLRCDTSCLCTGRLCCKDWKRNRQRLDREAQLAGQKVRPNTMYLVSGAKAKKFVIPKLVYFAMSVFWLRSGLPMEGTRRSNTASGSLGEYEEIDTKVSH
jgi:hypothetical protein